MSDIVPVESHLIEDGDPRVDEAFCSCRKWKIRDPRRNKRMAEAHRHLADQYDPPIMAVSP